MMLAPLFTPRARFAPASPPGSFMQARELVHRIAHRVMHYCAH